MAVSAYLDTSFIVSAFTEDTFTPRTRSFLRDQSLVPTVTDLGAVEMASALNRLVRTGEMARREATRSFAAFDRWSRDLVQLVQVLPADLAAAEGFLRRLDMNLRAPDAIHIAAAGRLQAELVTFDERMADCARRLGVAVAEL